MVSIFLSGLIAAYINWKVVFYIEGALCFFWLFFWNLYIEDSPEQQKRIITQEERLYIMDSLGQTENSHKIVQSNLSLAK